MRRIFPILLIVMCTFGFFTVYNSSAESKKSAQSSIYLLDLDKVYQESKPGKAAGEFLGGIQSKVQDEAMALQLKLQANIDDEKLKQEAQMAFSQMQQRIQAEEQNVMSILTGTVNKVVDDYRKEKNIPLVLISDAAVAYDKNIDITDDIMKIMDEQKLEFKAVVPWTPIVLSNEKAAPTTDNAKENAKPEGKDGNAKP